MLYLGFFYLSFSHGNYLFTFLWYILAILFKISDMSILLFRLVLGLLILAYAPNWVCCVLKHHKWHLLNWRAVVYYLKHQLIAHSSLLWMLHFAGHFVTLFWCIFLSALVWIFANSALYHTDMASYIASLCSQLKDDCLSATTMLCRLIKSLVLMSCPSVGSDGLLSLRWLPDLTYLDLSYTFLVNLQPVYESCLHLKVLLLPGINFVSFKQN